MRAGRIEPGDQRRPGRAADHVVTGADGWTLKTADGSLSAQFEHILVITRGRPVVVTAV